MNKSDKPRTNYTSFSEKTESTEEDVAQGSEPVEEDGRPAKTIPQIQKGVVANCSRLNVRSQANANADVVTIIDVKTKVDILEDANPAFYKIRQGKTIGFCMKLFISVQ